jgi:hypothetical protein
MSASADEALDRDLHGPVAKLATRQQCVDLVARTIELASAFVLTIGHGAR